ncbi:MAG TPA: TonB-dependent receptor, partial [Candidatus Binataceae bacterium]|nr:TonB-dependent receptor [Candidatus Binataceae bacterium]
YALYGQITDQFTNQFSGTLGARLTSDHVGVIDGSAAEGVPYTSLSHTWSDFSPKLTLNYEFEPKTMGYLTVSKGFKGGAYNSGAFQSAPIDPETLWDYELGVKADVTNHFRVDVSAFWYDYTNIQVQAFGASAVVAEDNNAAKARMIGADGDLTWTYGGVFATQDSLNVTAGFAALHSDYGEYRGASLATEQFVGCPNACTKIPAGDVITSVDASGNTLVDAPNFTLNLSVNYAWQTAIGRFGLTPAAYYNSGYFLDAANSARFKQGAFTKLNATANWESTDKHYTLQLWGKNLTGAKQLGGVLVSALGPAANGYAPATYGIRGAYHW